MSTLLGQIHLPDEADPTQFANAYHSLNPEFPLTPHKITYGVTVLKNSLQHQWMHNFKNEAANLKAVQTLTGLTSRLNCSESFVIESVARTLRLYLLGAYKLLSSLSFGS